MRINLVTPFAEKDAVKALGARWDSTQRLWYILNVADLTPFLRWIPNMEAAAEKSGAVGQQHATKPKSAPPVKDQAFTSSSKPAIYLPHCGCDVLPWDDCVHTANDAPLFVSQPGKVEQTSS